jgi:organic radical activating enzyme
MHCAPSIIEGWDIERQRFRDAHASDELVKLVTEFSNACTLNCPGCFTVKLDDEEDIHASLTKQRLRGEMSSETRVALLEEAVGLGATSVDIVGAGEPMIDPSLKSFVERAATLGVHVNIFTHGAHKELLEPDRLEWWREMPQQEVMSQNQVTNGAPDLQDSTPRCVIKFAIEAV